MLRWKCDWAVVLFCSVLDEVVREGLSKKTAFEKKEVPLEYVWRGHPGLRECPG